MKAKSPGKLVISGAYAVLRGAPALVTAVDRYVTADDETPCRFETPEVAAALELLGDTGAHPDFDATELREGDRKLGLGSSAAICASSMALVWLRRTRPEYLPGDPELAQAIYDTTLLAHRKAQGGGSGIDVAAACFGGTLSALRSIDEHGQPQLTVHPADLPPQLVVETWSCPHAASTKDFVRKVFSLEQSAPELFEQRMGAQQLSSERAASAARKGDADALVSALREQVAALSALGDAAGVPIVLPAVAQLHDSLDAGACFIPSGAGGGDVTLYISTSPSSASFRAAAQALEFELVPLRVGARGVHFLP